MSFAVWLRDLIDNLKLGKADSVEEVRNLFRKPLDEFLAKQRDEDLSRKRDRVHSEIIRWICLDLARLTEKEIVDLSSPSSVSRKLALRPDVMTEKLTSRFIVFELLRVRKAFFQSIPKERAKALLAGSAGENVGDELSETSLAEASDEGILTWESGAFTIHAFFKPLHERGGDWYLWKQDSSGQCWGAVFDTTGHDWLAFAIKRSLRIICHTQIVDSARSPAEVLSSLNRRILEADFLPDGCFFEATSALFKPCGKYHLSSAGGGFALVRHALEGTFSQQRLGGSFPLGLFDVDEYHATSDRLLPGDEIVISTDGLYEQPTPDGMLGQRYQQKGVTPSVPSPLIRHLTQELFRAWDACGRQDDVTLLGFTFRSNAEKPSGSAIPIRRLSSCQCLMPAARTESSVQDCPVLAEAILSGTEGSREQALDSLLRKFDRLATYIATHAIGNRTGIDLEDIRQEIFTEWMTLLPTWDSSRFSLCFWCAQKGSNCAARAVRKSRLDTFHYESEEDLGQQFIASRYRNDSERERRDLVICIEEVVRKLDPQYQQAIDLVYRQQLRMSDAALKMNVDRRTLTRWFNAVLERLRLECTD